MTFRAQAQKWPDIVMAHVETVIVVVHRFIMTLLSETFGDQRMREELWSVVLLEKLQTAYARAKTHADFLLGIEINGRPRTFNHYFNDELQKARAERLAQTFHEAAGDGDDSGNGDRKIDPSALAKMVQNKSNGEQTTEDIHDCLQSYYKVSRKRFVDVICRQVVDHYLLDGAGSPLKVLNPGLVAAMRDAQLELIAGEDVLTKRERERLKAEIQGLEAAMKVLKG